MKIRTERKRSITMSKAFLEEWIAPVFSEYPEYREGKTRVRVTCTHFYTNTSICFVDF